MFYSQFGVIFVLGVIFLTSYSTATLIYQQGNKYDIENEYRVKKNTK